MALLVWIGRAGNQHIAFHQRGQTGQNDRMAAQTIFDNTKSARQNCEQNQHTALLAAQHRGQVMGFQPVHRHCQPVRQQTDASQGIGHE